ncbi:MAG: hypothetical protein SP1CHLAM54_13070 [Chlamydiia bacterium]|nr:hypothetical protein [Chlamydiia bacterium]MCH9616203.1 hypothetical protein [Chlamydiia bacterium]MCH9629811.1 hypothetical protein [Chlamydiia bacterium]
MQIGELHRFFKQGVQVGLTESTVALALIGPQSLGSVGPKMASVLTSRAKARCIGPVSFVTKALVEISASVNSSRGAISGLASGISLQIDSTSSFSPGVPDTSTSRPSSFWILLPRVMKCSFGQNLNGSLAPGCRQTVCFDDICEGAKNTSNLGSASFSPIKSSRR